MGHKLNHTDELCISPKTANFLLISVTSYVVKDVEAPDGLNIFSMYVPSVGYGTSTVVETKGATDMFAMTWVVKVEVSWTLRHDCAMRSRTITHQVNRKREVQTSRTNGHPKFSQTLSSKQRSSGKLSETLAGTSAHNVGSNERRHAIQNDH